jgi:MoaA/NifB/PqqE/SkfB family radical SAM enzyme
MNASLRTGAGEPLPRLVFWEVTKGCNLRCMHCRVTATELESPKDLPTAQCLNIIDQLASLANPTLVLSGGEPLYRSDIFQLAQYAAEKGLRVELATNGTLVTKEVAQKIVEAGIQRVSISLDGASADTHDSFRGIPGAFDAAIYGFRNLKALGMPVQIDMTIARHNAGELPKMLEMVRNLGADALNTFLFVPAGCGVDIADAQMVTPAEYERILKWLHDNATAGGIEINATCAPPYSRVERQRLNASPAIGFTEMNKDCPAGTGVCFVSFEGEVFSCGYLPAIAGDLRKQPFFDIWNNAAVFADLRNPGKQEDKRFCVCVYESKALAHKE